MDEFPEACSFEISPLIILAGVNFHNIKRNAKIEGILLHTSDAFEPISDR